MNTEYAIISSELPNLNAAVFYTQSEDSKTTWAYYCGDAGAGSNDVGFVKFAVNTEDTDYEYHYFSFDGEMFTEDKLTGEEVEVELDQADRDAFEKLNNISCEWVSFDDDSEVFIINDEKSDEFTDDFEEVYSEDVDLELLQTISSHWLLQHTFSSDDDDLAYESEDDEGV